MLSTNVDLQQYENILEVQIRDWMGGNIEGATEEEIEDLVLDLFYRTKYEQNKNAEIINKILLGLKDINVSIRPAVFSPEDLSDPISKSIIEFKDGGGFVFERPNTVSNIIDGPKVKELIYGLKRNISKRAAMLDYPKKMLEEITQWAQTQMIILDMKGKASQVFDIDITDTKPYQDPEFRKMFSLETSNNRHKKLQVILYDSDLGYTDRVAKFSYNPSEHTIEVYDAKRKIKNGSFGPTIRHELTHLIQYIMRDVINNQRIFRNKSPIKFPGLPSNYNKKTVQNYNANKSVDILRHNLSDIEFYPQLQSEMRYLEHFLDVGKLFKHEKKRFKRWFFTPRNLKSLTKQEASSVLDQRFKDFTKNSPIIKTFLTHNEEKHERFKKN